MGYWTSCYIIHGISVPFAQIKQHILQNQKRLRLTNEEIVKQLSVDSILDSQGKWIAETLSWPNTQIYLHYPSGVEESTTWDRSEDDIHCVFWDFRQSVRNGGSIKWKKSEKFKKVSWLLLDDLIEEKTTPKWYAFHHYG